MDLCTWLGLKGKIKLAKEGVNGTFEGCNCSVDVYIKFMLNHKLFALMTVEDFKTSNGNGNCFRHLKISICDEICTMGVDPNLVTPEFGGKHLTPKEFHDFMSRISTKKEKKEVCFFYLETLFRLIRNLLKGIGRVANYPGNPYF